MKFFGKSQDQSAASNSVAIQAGRDLHYHGLSLADVREACEFFLENNFPRLQDAARLKAEENVRQFVEKFSDQLKEEAAKVLVQKFTDPEVQATMNDAVKACARKGEAASPDLLSKLLTHRMEDNTPFLDLVLSEAVTVVPKLSKAQLAFIAYSYVIRSLHPSTPSYAWFETTAKAAFPIVSPGFELSQAQKLHLDYAGAININSMMGGDPYEIFYNMHRTRMGLKSIDEFKGSLKLYCPSYNILLKNVEANNLFQADLTSVGFAIAITLLKPVLPIDMSSWLQ